MTASSPSPESQPRAARSASDHRSEFVVAAGSFSTLVALYVVYAAAHRGENIMGWYANYIIPAGALIVGMTAASGYGIAAWVTGLKMTPRLMWSVAGQLGLSYFIAQYEEFHLVVRDGAAMGFWEWFDASTRAFAWKQTGGGMGSPLGLLGYGLRVLEFVGFVGGGLMVPLALRAKPYCEPCATYKRTRLIAVLPAGKPRRVFGSAPPAEELAAREEGITGTQAIFDAALRGDRGGLDAELRTRGSLDNKGAARKLTSHINVHLVRCPRCADGLLTASLTQGTGQNIRVSQLGSAPLPPEQIRSLFD